MIKNYKEFIAQTYGGKSKSCTGSCCYCEARCSFSKTGHRGSCACHIHRATQPCCDSAVVAASLRLQLLQSDEWWHKEWHRATGIPCDGISEYCPIVRRFNESRLTKVSTVDLIIADPEKMVKP